MQANAYINQTKQFDDGEDNNPVKFEQVNFSGFINKPQSNVGTVPLVGGFSSKKGSPKAHNHFAGIIPNEQS